MNEIIETAPPMTTLKSELTTPELLEERILDSRASRFGKTVIERVYRISNGKVYSILLVSSGGRDPYIVFPLTDHETVILVKQFRFGTNKWVLELPGGCVNPGQDWRLCARKELLQETGAVARTMEIIGSPMPFNPALEGTYFHAVLAKDCGIVGVQHLERSEIMRVVEFSLHDFRNALHNGVIVDGKTVAIGYLALDHLGLL